MTISGLVLFGFYTHEFDLIKFTNVLSFMFAVSLLNKWNDILDLMDSAQAHYMGHIQLKAQAHQKVQLLEVWWERYKRA